MRRLEPWPPGTPCWLDVMTPDPEATHRFYGDLFGWQFRADDPGYEIATLDGAAVAGIITDDGHPAVWNVYLAVADLDAAGATVTAAGGEILTAGRDVSGGRLLIAREPSGAVFCLWQAGDDIGCEVFNETGAFIWCELLSRDYDAATRFHAEVFAHELTDIGGDAFDFATLAVAGNVVGGIGRMPADFPPDVPSHWRLYFGAADVDGTVARATELGASVSIDAHDTPFGRWAALVDPLGARFCVITPPPA